jgi:hypothetical protein
MIILTWIVIACTILVVIITLYNMLLVDLLHNKFVEALEKDIIKILKDKGIV